MPSEAAVGLFQVCSHRGFSPKSKLYLSFQWIVVVSNRGITCGKHPLLVVVIKVRCYIILEENMLWLRMNWFLCF
jgi:hypothetical protein